MNLRLLKEIKYFEKQKINALQSQDGIMYCNTCENLGVNPEDTYLYQQGLATRLYNESK